MIPASTVLTKAAGIVGAGIVLYDANAKGKATAFKTAKNKNVEVFLKHMNNNHYLTNESQFTLNMKKKLFDWDQTSHLPARTLFNKVKGYIKGFTNNIGKHIVPAALSVGAMALKGKAGKASAIGLGAYGIYSFFAHTIDYYKKPF